MNKEYSMSSMVLKEYSSLYIVATPIGNLQDISSRAIEVITQSDILACEDTRQTQKLLKYLGIQRKMIAIHAHNEKQQSKWLIEQIKQGFSVALVSDAGTPLISDPGAWLVRLAHEEKIKVIPIPGACATISALSALGSHNSFTFHGFLPVKSGDRSRKFSSWKGMNCTHVFYEAPHRMKSVLQDIIGIFGEECHIGIAREITKIYEEIIWTGAQDYLIQKKDSFMGEHVVVVPPQKSDEPSEEEIYSILKSFIKPCSAKEASILAEEFFANRAVEISKKKLYQVAVKIKNAPDDK